MPVSGGICHTPFGPPWEELEAGRQAAGKAEQGSGGGGLPLVLGDRAEWKQEGLRGQRRPQPQKTLGTGPELWSPALTLGPRRRVAEPTRGNTVRGSLTPDVHLNRPIPDLNCLGNGTEEREKKVRKPGTS